MSQKSPALLWSVIAAAFVGPGTVATAARAGSEGGLAFVLPLLGALAAGYLLMEMAARVTLVSGQSLGRIIGNTFGPWVSWLLFSGIMLGCCTYEAGNLLGGFAGLELLVPLPRGVVLALVGLAALVLWSGRVDRIGRILAAIVLLMGLAFLGVGSGVLTAGLPPEPPAPLSATTVLALFGTTIVPYNFMLAAGLAPGQALGAMRGGLALSFAVGGLVTLGVLLTGTTLTEFTDFTQLASTLEARLGNYGSSLLGLGLLAAGFSSAITAPLAAAVAGRALLGQDARPGVGDWSPRGGYFRLVWGLVLGLGALVACLDVQIVGVIVAAQFVNALLLPGLAALVLLLGSRGDLLGDQRNSIWLNLLGLAVFAYLCVQGLIGLGDVVGKSVPLWLISFLVTNFVLWLGRRLWLLRKAH